MKISEDKRRKISEQILAFLFQESPRACFTFHIAREIARDEEFIKEILKDLNSKKLVLEIKKNKEGVPYLRRSRWRLSPLIYETYKRNQNENRF